MSAFAITVTGIVTAVLIVVIAFDEWATGPLTPAEKSYGDTDIDLCRREGRLPVSEAELQDRLDDFELYLVSLAVGFGPALEEIRSLPEVGVESRRQQGRHP